MTNLKYLFNKSKETLKEDGFLSLITKTCRYLTGKKNPNRTNKSYKDILFINGCSLPHPSRYRVEHQMEQLLANGLTADTVFYENLDFKMEKYYKTFIFFRCPITENISKFIDIAKSQNKAIFYDIDDLVFDTQYTESVKYLKTLNNDELALYNDGVTRMGNTLKKCDYAITTTTALANELKKYVKDVYINRNTASEEMVKLSEKAMLNTKRDSSKIIIGYLSGSITHNSDFELIMPTIKKILKNYNNVYLKVAGILDVPKELEEVSDKIITTPFVSWKKLPEIISTIDINIAPLEKNLFNEAKSENKWIEASLCKVVTVASNIGAFKEMINNEYDGFLCNDDEWYDTLTRLIKNENLRKEVAQNAYKRVIKDNVTIYNGYGLTNFITNKTPKIITFVLPSTNISGGVNVIIKHCNILKKYGYITLIINQDKKNDNIINENGETDVVSACSTTIDAKIDVMVATLWSTLEYVRLYGKANKKKYLVQGFETDFMKFGDNYRLMANSTYSYDNIDYLTISKWCKSWLENKYKRKVNFIPNGIDLKKFTYKKRTFTEKIKILIEGNCDDHYKNVDESFRIVEMLDKNKYEIIYLSYSGNKKDWYHTDKFMYKIPHDQVYKVYQEADILIKSSILESFSYPPLEMMATGGISIVVPNEGNVEYLTDNENCLFYSQGNIEEAVRKIENLSSDERLREKLVKNGRKTVKNREWNLIEKEIVDVYTSN